MTGRDRMLAGARKGGQIAGPQNIGRLRAWLECPLNRAAMGRAISAGKRKRSRPRTQADLPKGSPVRVAP